MSRDKQIEEMANEINEMDEPNAHYYDETLQDHEAFADCFTIAKHLYEKGYRKASEVAEEIFAEIENIAILNGYISVKDFYTEHPLIAELKKKYTEGGE